VWLLSTDFELLKPMLGIHSQPYFVFNTRGMWTGLGEGAQELLGTAQVLILCD
jgi:hypothetical protein